MIHFDFTVTDEEAEAIFDAIGDEIDRCNTEVIFGNPIYKEWNRNRVSYLNEIKKKMTNKWIV